MWIIEDGIDWVLTQGFDLVIDLMGLVNKLFGQG